MLDSDSNNLPLDSIIDQLSYDKIVSKYGSEKADMFPISESSMDAYRKFYKNHMMELDEDKYDLAEAENYADYKTLSKERLPGENECRAKVPKSYLFLQTPLSTLSCSRYSNNTVPT